MKEYEAVLESFYVVLEKKLFVKNSVDTGDKILTKLSKLNKDFQFIRLKNDNIECIFDLSNHKGGKVIEVNLKEI
ncbi:hypothetical protein [Schnuerera sp.]|uniref:hypothetical protein n=1 Tax=Schnuerera sp. TaxID=2794844 RepID=UPI002B743FEC|nr:hypothetical protein [Schnuerera sp.]HSH35414.1 hypothetical protein [Schnuerera sp.]